MTEAEIRALESAPVDYRDRPPGAPVPPMTDDNVPMHDYLVPWDCPECRRAGQLSTLAAAAYHSDGTRSLDDPAGNVLEVYCTRHPAWVRIDSRFDAVEITRLKALVSSRDEELAALRDRLAACDAAHRARRVVPPAPEPAPIDGEPVARQVRPAPAPAPAATAPAKATELPLDDIARFVEQLLEQAKGTGLLELFLKDRAEKKLERATDQRRAQLSMRLQRHGERLSYRLRGAIDANEAVPEAIADLVDKLDQIDADMDEVAFCCPDCLDALPAMRREADADQKNAEVAEEIDRLLGEDKLTVATAMLTLLADKIGSEDPLVLRLRRAVKERLGFDPIDTAAMFDDLEAFAASLGVDRKGDAAAAPAPAVQVGDPLPATPWAPPARPARPTSLTMTADGPPRSTRTTEALGMTKTSEPAPPASDDAVEPPDPSTELDAAIGALGSEPTLARLVALKSALEKKIAATPPPPPRAVYSMRILAGERAGETSRHATFTEAEDAARDYIRTQAGMNTVRVDWDGEGAFDPDYFTGAPSAQRQRLVRLQVKGARNWPPKSTAIDGDAFYWDRQRDTVVRICGPILVPGDFQVEN